MTISKKKLMGRKPTIFNCSIIEFNKIKNRAGSISPIEALANIPFEIERVFYLYDIPSGENRGAHAHKECHQLLIAASGSFDIELTDGINKRTIALNRPYFGLHIPPGIWAAEKSFSSGAVCLVLASHKFDENDYIRDYNIFLSYVQNESTSL
jgi:hypothetical protein